MYQGNQEGTCKSKLLLVLAMILPVFNGMIEKSKIVWNLVLVNRSHLVGICSDCRKPQLHMVCNFSVCSRQQSGKLRPFLQSLLAICDRAGMCGEAERWSAEAVRESILSCSSICILECFDKRLKFPQLFTAYLGILTVWLQTDTPKIRVFIPSFERFRFLFWASKS